MNNRSEQLSGSPTTAPTPLTTDTADAAPRHRRRWPIVAGIAATALVASGSVAYAEAHKTVTLDVDGTTTTVTTYAGAVSGLLAREGVRTGERDLVAPGLDAELTDGAQIVVRYGRQVTMAADGEQSDVWLTVVDAAEALQTLADRGTAVSLVPSRSGDRVSLPLRLDTDSPVAVVADGDTLVAQDGADTVDGVLADVKVELDADDRVSVVASTDAPAVAAAAEAAEKAEAAEEAETAETAEKAEAAETAEAVAAAEVAVVVERVATEEVTTTSAVPFESETRQDAERYADEGKAVEQAGAEGVRTVVERVTTVDGVEESRELVSDEVTQAPVTEVVVEGTKERPVVTAPAESSSSTSSSSSSAASSGPVMSGSNREIGQQLAAARGWTGSQWTCLDSLFQRESGWNHLASNPSSGAYGIPQALPGSKMGTVAADWQTNPATQITWGLNYIAGRYGTPCGAWSHSESAGWY